MSTELKRLMSLIGTVWPTHAYKIYDQAENIDPGTPTKEDHAK